MNEAAVVEEAKLLPDALVDVGESATEEEAELLLVGDLTAPSPELYISSRLGPPQYSDELPLQGILHPDSPSGAGPPPPLNELPQSICLC